MFRGPPPPCEVTPGPRTHPNPGLPGLQVCRPFFPPPWPTQGSRQVPNATLPFRHTRRHNAPDKGPPGTPGTQHRWLRMRYATRCRGLCAGLCPNQVLPLATIPSSGPLPDEEAQGLPCSGLGPWGGGRVTGGLPSTFIPLCRNQPGSSLSSLSLC